MEGDGIERVDNNHLYKLISGLISCGFRGSAKSIANEHIDDYLIAQNEIREVKPSASDNTTKEATETPWPCKFSDSLVCAAKSCSDTNCDIYEPA